MPHRDAPLTRFALVVLIAAGLTASGCREREAAAKLPTRTLAAPAGTGGPAAPATAPAPPSPAAAASNDGRIGTTVLSGTLEPRRRSTLMPKVGGWVVKVHVNEGDFVKRGAPLVSVDPAQFRLTLRQAQAGYEGAKVALAAIKLEWDRHRALLAEKAVPQGQFDMIDAKYKGALVQVKAAEVALDMARKALRDTTIYAPYNGVVVKKHVSEGDNAAAMPPTPLITMEETEVLDLRVQVPSTELERVKAGTPVRVHFPAGPPDVTATVSRVVPTINPGTRTFSVIVELDNSKNLLRAGLFAEVSLGAAPAALPAPAGAKATGRRAGARK